MRKLFKPEKGITLVALVITIIVLLILAGISIMGLSGNNGLISKTQKAKIKTQLSTAKQEVSLAISGLIAENIGNKDKITPQMIANQVNSENNRKTYAENENTFPTNIIYPKEDTGIGDEIQIKVGSDLEIIEVKTAKGITNNDNSGTDNSGNDDNKNIENVGKVNITISDVKYRGFTINVEPENENNIALYQYYVNNELKYEGKEKQYTVRNLKGNTNYQVEVKAIPKTTVSVGKLQQATLDIPIIEMSNKFDKYIYIDSNSGNDTTGNGSEEKPYATLDKIAASGIIEQGYSYGIILNSGIYNFTNSMIRT